MKKNLVILFLLAMFITGCNWPEIFTGKKITKTDTVTGEKTYTYEEAPITKYGDLLSVILPGGLGLAAAAALRIARNAARARDGIMDANEDAIENADWKQINTKESFKALLGLAQDSHDDSKLLKKQYVKWKSKKKRNINKPV